MKRTLIILLLIMMSSVALADCWHGHCHYYHSHHSYGYYGYSPSYGMNNEGAGTLVGGIAGGLLGSTIGSGGGQLVAIAAGTLAGALIGGNVGRNMDYNDHIRMHRALEQNSVGVPAYWHNAHSGNTYRVIPVRNVTVGSNPYCREYRTIADIGGQKKQMYGTACRQPDGSWKAVS